MKGLSELLASLESEWQRMACVDVRRLARGQARQDTERLLRGAGLVPTAELLDWFAWHDGLQTDQPGKEPVYLEPSGFQLASFAQCLQLREDLLTLAEQIAVDGRREFGRDSPEGEPSFHFDPRWMPIGDNAGGTTLVAEAGAEAGPFRIFSVNWEDDEFRTPRASSISEMVELWIHVLRTYYKPGAGGSWSFEFTDLPVELRLTRLVG